MKKLFFYSSLVAISIVSFASSCKKTNKDTNTRETNTNTTETTSKAPNIDIAPKTPYYTKIPETSNRSTLADQLNQPAQTAQEDVALLKEVFFHYRSVFKQNPVGTQQEILAAISGNNREKAEYIPKNHPAVTQGKLYDRWGTPYFFHQLSGTDMEIRSAGPDKIHWNNDDITTK